LPEENKPVQATIICLQENWTLGIVINMTLAETQRLRTFDFDVKPSISHATRVGIGKRKIAQVGFVFFGQFYTVRIDQL